MFNFSDPVLAEWYVHTYLGEVANSSAFDVIYFDAGGNSRGRWGHNFGCRPVYRIRDSLYRVYRVASA
jgi:hypothetical protein